VSHSEFETPAINEFSLMRSLVLLNVLREIGWTLPQK